jgi:hypothetical protein
VTTHKEVDENGNAVTEKEIHRDGVASSTNSDGMLKVGVSGQSASFQHTIGRFEPLALGVDGVNRCALMLLV